MMQGLRSASGLAHPAWLVFGVTRSGPLSHPSSDLICLMIRGTPVEKVVEILSKLFFYQVANVVFCRR